MYSYRIFQQGSKFYPQYKIKWFLWGWKFYQPSPSLKVIHFPTLAEAKTFIDNDINNNNKTFIYKYP